MQNIFFDKNKKYISSRNAAKLTKYTSDYIGQLCREGKLDAIKKGRVWFVSESSLNTYITSDTKTDVASQSSSHPLSQPIRDKHIYKDISDTHPAPILSPVSLREREVSLQYFSDDRPLLPRLSKEFNFLDNHSKQIPSAPASHVQQKSKHFLMFRRFVSVSIISMLLCYVTTQALSVNQFQNTVSSLGLVAETETEHVADFFSNPYVAISPARDRIISIGQALGSADDFYMKMASVFAAIAHGDIVITPRAVSQYAQALGTSSLFDSLARAVYKKVNDITCTLFCSYDNVVLVSVPTPIMSTSSPINSVPQTQPVAVRTVERVIERISAPEVVVDGITREEFENRLATLQNDINIIPRHADTGGQSTVIYQDAIPNTFGIGGDKVTIDGDVDVGGTLTVSALTIDAQTVQDLTVDGTTLLAGPTGIGTTSPAALFAVGGNSYFGGSLTVEGGFTALGTTTLGTNVTDSLVVNGYVASDLIPDFSATRNLGSPSRFWNDAYIDTLTVNNISAASTTIGGTQSETFTINSDNATTDDEDVSLIFYRGSVVPNAVIAWDSTLDRFHINQPFFIQNDAASTTIPTLALQSDATQTSDILHITSVNDAPFFNVTSVGNIGIGTSSPYAKLSVAGQTVAEYFTATSSTATSTFAGGFTAAGSSGLTVLQNGRVGIGTVSPTQALHVNGVLKVGTGTSLGATPETGDIVTDRRLLFNHTSAEIWSENDLTFYIDGDNDNGTSEKFRIITTPSGQVEVVTVTAAGNFGIGTTSPYAKLSVAGDAVIGGSLTLSSLTATSSIGASAFYAALGSESVPSYSFTSDTNTGIFSEAADNLDLVTGGTARVKVSTSGLIVGGATGKLFFNSADSVSSGSADTDLYRNASGVLRTSGSFVTDGKIGVGSTSPYANLSVKGTGFGSSINFQTTNASDAPLFSILDNGRVGIGIVNPDHVLDIYNISSTYIRVGSSGGNKAGLKLMEGSNDNYGFTILHDNNLNNFQLLRHNNDTTGVVAMSIDRSSGATYFSGTGNVGIGSTSPYAKLSVKGAGTSTGINFQTTNSSDAPLFSILDTGRVGIGTVNPGSELQITANAPKIFITGTSNTSEGIYLQDSTGATGRMRQVTGKLQFDADYGNSVGASNITFRVDGSEWLRIDNAGNVGIGTTSPYTRLSVAGSAVVGDSIRTSSIAATSTTATSTFAGGLTVGTSNLVVDSATTYVGFGVSTPTARISLPSSTSYLDGIAFGTDTTNLYRSGSGQLATLATFNAPYINVTSALYGGSSAGNNLFIDSTSNASKGSIILGFGGGSNVGIGTSSPYAKLSVAGQTVAEYFTATSTTATSTFAGGLTVGTSNLVVDRSTGWIGLGTQTPGRKLDVTERIRLRASGSSAGLWLTDSAGTEDVFVGLQGTSATSDFGIFSSGAWRLALTNAGKLGIGTTTPYQLLSVAGNAAITGNLTAFDDVWFGAATTNTAPFWWDVSATTTYIGNGGTGDSLVQFGPDADAWSIGFYQTDKSFRIASSTGFASADVLTIEKGGQVGIGTSAPDYVLHVSRSGDGAVAGFTDSNGTCTIDPTSTALLCSSDRTLKKDITSLDQFELLDKVVALNTVSYHWKTEDSASPTRLGFIAQEVEEIFPQFVSMSGNGKKAVAYGSFTPVLASAIQAINLDITATSTMFAGTERLTLIGRVVAYFESVGLKIKDGIIAINNLMTDSIEVGSPEKPTGITLYDEVTGEPYCLSIQDGVPISATGVCGSTSSSSSVTSNTKGGGGHAAGNESGDGTSDSGESEVVSSDNAATTTPPIAEEGDVQDEGDSVEEDISQEDIMVEDEHADSAPVENDNALDNSSGIGEGTDENESISDEEVTANDESLPTEGESSSDALE